MPLLPVIKRGGIYSKRRACHWCHNRRRTGWWVLPRNRKKFRPACSSCATQFIKHVQTSAFVNEKEK